MCVFTCVLLLGVSMRMFVSVSVSVCLCVWAEGVFAL